MTTVLLLGYNRPEFLSKRIGEISKNRPSSLIISIDGNSDKSVSSKIMQSLEKAIDTYFDPSSVRVLHNKSNLGLALNVTSSISSILEESEKVTIIEDDIEIGDNFLKNIELAYSSFQSDENIATVGGFSGMPAKLLSSKLENRWRQTKYFSAWGWSIDAVTWEKFRLTIPAHQIEFSLQRSVSWNQLTLSQKEIWFKRFSKVASLPTLTWDYQMQYMSFKYDLVHVLPLFRICENVGFEDSRSTNTRNRRPTWMGAHYIDDRIIERKTHPWHSHELEKHLDSFTISGDSRIRSIVNALRK